MLEIPKDLLDEWIKINAPFNTDQKNNKSFIANHLNSSNSFNAIVVTADIRKSTLVMKEAIDFQRYAQILQDFIRITVDDNVRRSGGWFEKFTGDGFIVYWPYDYDPLSQFIKKQNSIFSYLYGIQRAFHSSLADAFRANSHNFPDGFGLCIGVDAGPIYLNMVSRTMTVLGLPVVGAVRMVSTSHTPGEIVINNIIGYELINRYTKDNMLVGKYPISKEIRATKEFPAQEVYVIQTLP